MKQLFIVLILSVFIIRPSFGQLIPEFQTTIYVMDLDGNVDSVVVGYDSSASDDLDTQFGEIDITSQPWDSVLEVRVSPKFNLDDKLGKKQIGYYNCLFAGSGIKVCQVNLSIRANTPVVITWNMQDFQDDCRDSSAIVDDQIFFQYAQFHYGRSLMGQRANHGSTFDLPGYVYYFYQGNIEGGGTDTIYNVFIGFVDDLNDIIGSTKQQQIQEQTKTFPNPATESFTIQLPSTYYSESVTIFDITGRQFYQNTVRNNEIKVSTANWTNGIYFYQVRLEDGILINGKVVKN